MMTKEESRKLVLGKILENWNVFGDEPVILDDFTIEKDFGWVFFYSSRKFIETEEFDY